MMLLLIHHDDNDDDICGVHLCQSTADERSDDHVEFDDHDNDDDDYEFVHNHIDDDDEEEQENGQDDDADKINEKLFLMLIPGHSKWGVHRARHLCW